MNNLYDRSINLRPWREELRQLKQKKFNQLALLMVLLSLLIGLIMWNSLTSSINSIKAENQIIDSKLLVVKQQIKQIANLKEQRQQLIQRLNVIKQLQGKRSSNYLILTQFVESLNEGVFFTQVERKDNQLTLQGSATHSQAVAELLRSLAEQPSFIDAVLTSLNYNEQTGLMNFNLYLTLEGAK